MLRTTTLSLLTTSLFASALNVGALHAQKADQEAAFPVAERFAGDDEHKHYFLIGPRGDRAPAKGYRLLLVLPGGDGSADFHPFVKRIAQNATGEDYVVAQLVAPQWDAKQKIVWPTDKSRTKGMKFSTEEYIDAVVEDVATQLEIDPAAIFTLSWSSGGPAAYAASLQRKSRITGSLVAMSVFKKDQLPSLKGAKGHAYYILHSEQDRVCPFRMAEDAAEKLAKAKAEVKFATYDGGHGWHGNVYGNLRTGLQWLERKAKARQGRKPPKKQAK